MAPRSICSVADCDNTPIVKGLCHLHYRRLWRHGDPLGKRKLNDGRHKHPLYQIWKEMVRRCTNKNRPNSECYVGRGIDVCASWREDFWNFVADIGARPSRKHSIERINNDGDYEPSNCRWATASEQSFNRRSNRHLNVNGQTKFMTDWAWEVDIDRRTISSRLKWGWSEHDAVMTPIRPHKQYKERNGTPRIDAVRAK